MKIVLIDDDEIILRTMVFYLEKHGYNVTGTTDGAEARRLLLQENPDLLITDMMMPKVSGFDLIKIAKQEANPKVAVLLMTGFDQPELIKTAFDMGIEDFAIKPVNMSELSLRIQRIERILGK